MKKFLGFAVAIAMSVVVAGCGDTNPTDDNGNNQDILIVPDNGDSDVVVNPDAEDRDNFTGTDTNTNPDNNVTPDTNVQDNGGTDTNVTPDEGGNDCIPDPGSCQNYYACVGECNQGDTECEADCQGSLSAQGQADLQAFSQCLTQNGCNNVTTQDAFMECLNANCVPEYYGCFHGCMYENCAELYDCYDGCPDDDPATSEDEGQLCGGDCQSNTTVEGLLQMDAFSSCYIAECPICGTYTTEAELKQCNECYGDAIWGVCFDEFKACSTEGTEYTDCREFSVCFTACQYSAATQAEYDACSAACQEGVTLSALKDRIDAEECSLTQCEICAAPETEADRAQCNECWDGTIFGDDTNPGACEAEWSVCVFGTTTDNCRDMYACMRGCTDFNCYVGCQFNATKDARKSYEGARACSLDACPICTTGTTQADETACDECFNASVTGDCATEWAVCLPEPGTKSCNTVYQCMAACEDQACVQTCFDEGDANAQQLYNTMVECLNTECPGDQWTQTCLDGAVNGACNGAYTACTSDTQD